MAKAPPRIAASQSFTKDEVRFLMLLLNTMLRGGDVRPLRERKGFKRLYSKAVGMKQRIESQEEKRALSENDAD